MQKRFWHLPCKDSFEFTRKASENQYLDVLRTLVPPQVFQVLAALAISEI